MPALLQAPLVNGKKSWRVYGANGNEKRIRMLPTVNSRREAYSLLAQELGVPEDQVISRLGKVTPNGSGWSED